MAEVGRTETSDSRFVAAVLFFCAAGALWLLLSPAAFKRRASALRAEQLEAEVRREWLQNAGLERWRNALESDPAVIEREARKLGYGRPGEGVYPLSSAELRAAFARVRAGKAAGGGSLWFSAIRDSVAPVLLLIIGGTIALLFFTDLRIEDPAE